MKRSQSRKPVDIEQEKKKWHVIPVQYVVFAAVRA
jgi:hypothetical protein